MELIAFIYSTSLLAPITDPTVAFGPYRPGWPHREGMVGGSGTVGFAVAALTKSALSRMFRQRLRCTTRDSAAETGA